MEIKHITSDVLGENLRWKVELPMNFRVQRDLTGFVALSDRVFISVKAIYYFLDPDWLEDDVISRIETHLYSLLNIAEYRILNREEKTHFSII